MESETVDPLDWPVPPTPYGVVPSDRQLHMEPCTTRFNQECNHGTFGTLGNPSVAYRERWSGLCGLSVPLLAVILYLLIFNALFLTN